jgi:hypothetical protein
MSLWTLLLIICACGAIGGVVNALLTDNGFMGPRVEDVGGGAKVIRPGFLGNIFIGAIAASLSWGLYGPMASFFIAGTGEALKQNPVGAFGLTLSSLVGAVLVGIGGARWLTNEVDKDLLQAAASQAAAGEESPEASQRIALATPAQALFIAKSLRR